LELKTTNNSGMHRVKSANGPADKMPEFVRLGAGVAVAGNDVG